MRLLQTFLHEPQRLLNTNGHPPLARGHETGTWRGLFNIPAARAYKTGRSRDLQLREEAQLRQRVTASARGLWRYLHSPLHLPPPPLNVHAKNMHVAPIQGRGDQCPSN
ncbi:hypothetical protein NDU88_004527 [Pleurodeles waltl]|uniref:Uncharacterized protein n=1 Tax=Pleurodeles waltl TaxID=8319 RepID=A0AAV7M6J8_PLEWA|nr:hypothetical protein NDU88_004527 [Pleurodeles waltl]